MEIKRGRWGKGAQIPLRCPCLLKALLSWGESFCGDRRCNRRERDERMGVDGTREVVAEQPGSLCGGGTSGPFQPRQLSRIVGLSLLAGLVRATHSLQNYILFL